ncbi:MAG: T9SS type A sorting domain-containing protein [Bacteroidia bacterium]|nr:T9SS type A sorting domain-containing protein [Bacteroidia bacterium]
MKKIVFYLSAVIGFVFISKSQVATTLNFSIAQTPCLTGLSATEIQPVISVFPNPSNGSFMVNVKGKKDFLSPVIKVSSLLGETILQTEEKKISSDYSKQLDLSALPNGIYFVHVTITGASYSKVLRIAINH